MSVLKFGFPAYERLRCEHPVCNELAQWRIPLKVSEEEGTNALTEIFACTGHSAQLQIGQPVWPGIERLRVPGERNVPKVAKPAPGAKA